MQGAISIELHNGEAPRRITENKIRGTISIMM